LTCSWRNSQAQFGDGRDDRHEAETAFLPQRMKLLLERIYLLLPALWGTE
jgi:hypothetical protein